MCFKIKNSPFLLLAMVFMSISLTANAQSSSEKKSSKLNVDRIISAANSASSKDRRADSSREQRFRAEKSKQQKRLNNMINQRVQQERLSDRLDAQFKVNEVKIEELTEELAIELGDLKELFGVIQQTASDAQENYKESIITAQFPGRAEKLRQMVEKMGDTTQLISIEEIEEIWFELQNEMTQQGKIVKFNTPVSIMSRTVADDEQQAAVDYEKENRLVTRVGVFNAVTGNDIVTFEDKRGLVMLDRQMDKIFTSKSNELQNLSNGITPFYVDPTRGGLLSALVRKPSLLEKIQEGKIVGYIIIVLGVLAITVALIKILIIRVVEGSVSRQAKNLVKPSKKNPLGRLIKVFHDNPKSDPESLELKLSESILKETPKLNSWLMFVKIIAVVAPLLGLLGTVTGMIQTFQAITLYGAGDPQLMAGGISQALVTTVLGLVVAIPAVLLHSSAAGRARRVEGVLEEHAASLVAKRIETL